LQFNGNEPEKKVRIPLKRKTRMRRIWFSRQVTDERRRSSKDPPAGSLTENPKNLPPPHWVFVARAHPADGISFPVISVSKRRTALTHRIILCHGFFLRLIGIEEVLLSVFPALVIPPF
jgi:hypothetical protein